MKAALPHTDAYVKLALLDGGSFLGDLSRMHAGELEGKSVDGAVQFLGLKYASIKDRLAAPQLVDSYGSGTTDATRFGYVH